MTTRKIFDAHHHLWKLDHCHYPWLIAKGQRRFFGDPAPIQRDYLAAEFKCEASRYDVIGSTHIQVGVADEDSVKETEWLQSVSETEGLPSAIVAFADLTAEDLHGRLTSHSKSSRLRGIRQIIGRHPDEDALNKSGDLIENPDFLRGMKVLSERGLSFDLQLTETTYSAAARVLAKVPSLKVAICHFGSPWDLSREGFDRWQTAMATFAELPSISVKFSGFGMFKPDWNADDIAPFVEAALGLFGADRCMAGSNFPVDKLYGNYERIWDALATVIMCDDDYAKVTRENAIRFYDVDLTC